MSPGLERDRKGPASCWDTFDWQIYLRFAEITLRVHSWSWVDRVSKVFICLWHQATRGWSTQTCKSGGWYAEESQRKKGSSHWVLDILWQQRQNNCLFQADGESKKRDATETSNISEPDSREEGQIWARDKAGQFGALKDWWGDQAEWWPTDLRCTKRRVP